MLMKRPLTMFVEYNDASVMSLFTIEYCNKASAPCEMIQKGGHALSIENGPASVSVLHGRFCSCCRLINAGDKTLACRAAKLLAAWHTVSRPKPLFFLRLPLFIPTRVGIGSS
jgi:hypothetical protein